MNLIFIYITVPTKIEAKRIAKSLLMEKLIACANIFSIDSLYWWQGKIADGDEFVLIAKTVEENFGKVKAAVEKIHSYKTPCIVKISVEANKKFFAWVKGEIGK